MGLYDVRPVAVASVLSDRILFGCACHALRENREDGPNKDHLSMSTRRLRQLDTLPSFLLEGMSLA
jgi:hypothetical protein